MSERPNVSVCIPTYNRPEMLANCLSSLFTQSMLPEEVLVGDDSSDDRTERVIPAVEAPESVSFRYLRNRPGLGQSKNVEALFQTAIGDWLLLIHDDDWLLPNAIATLTNPLKAGIEADALYGNQLVAEADGSINDEASQALNPAWHRTRDWAGLQSNALVSAVIGQFPNNGWLVRRSLALDAGYHDKGIVDGCDYAFGLRLALKGARFYYQPKNVAVYRLSKKSVARGRSNMGTAAIDSVRILWKYRKRIPVTVETKERIRTCVYRAAVWCGLQRRHRLEALKWSLHPRFGISWIGREGAGVISALLFPELREKIKRMKAR